MTGSTYLAPYVNWRGQAREAMEFYASVLGGTLEVMTFADMGGVAAGVAEHEVEWVMHSALTVSDSVLLMGSDHPAHVPGEPKKAQISLSGDDEATLRRWWDGFAARADVVQPLGQAPWGDWFGSLDDHYGVHWMFNISGPRATGD